MRNATAAFLPANPSKQEHMEKATNDSELRQRWANKEAAAEHYAVCERTITNWHALGLLVFFKIGRVVRYDLVASDASLKEHGMI